VLEAVFFDWNNTLVQLGGCVLRRGRSRARCARCGEGGHEDDSGAVVQSRRHSRNRGRLRGVHRDGRRQRSSAP